MFNDENILPDDYPIYLGYWYIVNSIPVQSPYEGTVRGFKEHCFNFKVNEVRRCNAIARNLPLM
jgi:hypothetical protein